MGKNIKKTMLDSLAGRRAMVRPAMLPPYWGPCDPGAVAEPEMMGVHQQKYGDWFIQDGINL